jgi:Recombination enhancement, RecA-dependent nuclease
VSRTTPTTKAASRHMGRIKAMRCICCYLLDRQQRSITDVHHIREGRQERNDFLTIPLCHDDCHQGPSGVHGDKRWLRMLKVNEFGLLAVTLEQLEATA